MTIWFATVATKGKEQGKFRLEGKEFEMQDGDSSISVFNLQRRFKLNLPYEETLVSLLIKKHLTHRDGRVLYRRPFGCRSHHRLRCLGIAWIKLHYLSNEAKMNSLCYKTHWITYGAVSKENVCGKWLKIFKNSTAKWLFPYPDRRPNGGVLTSQWVQSRRNTVFWFDDGLRKSFCRVALTYAIRPLNLA
jgi:hypothetical protein